MKYAPTRFDVQVTEWAESYRKGDMIRFYNPHIDDTETKRIVGFSTMFDTMGQPVVEEMAGVDETQVPIPEEYHVNGK